MKEDEELAEELEKLKDRQEQERKERTIPAKEAAKLLFLGMAGGFFLGAYVLKWYPLQPGHGVQAYLVTEGQLFNVVLLLLATGFGLATVLQYPLLRIKKFIVKGLGEPVAVWFQHSSGNVSMHIVAKSKKVEIAGKLYELRKAAFNFLGLPGYIVHEDCSVSLDWNSAEIEKLKHEVAEELEKQEAEITVMGPEGQLERYKIYVPKAFTIQALSPVRLRQAYTAVYTLAMKLARVKAEKQIKATFALAVGAFMMSAVAAYFAYASAGGLEIIAKKMAELAALVKAIGGMQQ